MILIWRGWGLLAIVALFPLLASCAGLIDVEPKWVWIASVGLSLFTAGWICIYFGKRWNRHAYEHSLYFIPLQIWGWFYLGATGLLAMAGLGGAFQKGFKDDRTIGQGIAGLIGLLLVLGTALWLAFFQRHPLDDPDRESFVRSEDDDSY